MTQLVVYERARAALVEAKTLNEVRQIADKSEAIRAYAVMAKDRELELNAAELRIRAERRLGQMVAELRASPKIKVGGTRTPKVDIDPERRGFKDTLKDLAIGTNLASRSRRFASISEDRFEHLLSHWRARALQDTTVGLPPELRAGRRSTAPRVRFMIGGGDIRQWSIGKVRRTAAVLAAIADYCGGASGDESCGDLVNNDKLRALFGIASQESPVSSKTSKFDRPSYSKAYNKARGGMQKIQSAAH